MLAWRCGAWEIWIVGRGVEGLRAGSLLGAPRQVRQASVAMLARRRTVRQGGSFKHGSVSMEQQAREQAFISALTTQRFVLQAARSANVGEMTGRGTVSMGRCPAP